MDAQAKPLFFKNERPIAFASRTLAPEEKKYSQLDKEALAIIYGVRHFHQYIYGRSFIIVSDHKPLMHLFSESKATPAMASAKIQRWTLLLRAYDYHIEHKSAKENNNADALSRLPLPRFPLQVLTPPETVQLMQVLSTAPVSAAQIRTQTEYNQVLSKVKCYVQQSWPEGESTPELLPFSNRKDELSLQDGCILWGTRVVVPLTLRAQIMDELHEAHSGASRMKNLA